MNVFANRRRCCAHTGNANSMICNACHVACLVPALREYNNRHTSFDALLDRAQTPMRNHQCTPFQQLELWQIWRNEDVCSTSPRAPPSRPRGHPAGCIACRGDFRSRPRRQLLADRSPRNDALAIQTRTRSNGHPAGVSPNEGTLPLGVPNRSMPRNTDAEYWIGPDSRRRPDTAPHPDRTTRMRCRTRSSCSGRWSANGSPSLDESIQLSGRREQRSPQRSRIASPCARKRRRDIHCSHSPRTIHDEKGDEPGV